MKSIVTLARAALLSLLVSAGAMAADVVDINRADASELSRVLVGVGPAKAEAIIEYREEHGDFRSAEELAEVRGIGLALVERNIERIEVGPARRASRSRED
jgi:competence protein ComEA